MGKGRDVGWKRGAPLLRTSKRGTPLSRRRFAALAGSAVVGGLALRLDREARGVPNPDALRYLLYNHCNGLQNVHLDATSVDASGTPTFASFMEAFTPHRDDVTVVRNLYCTPGSYLHGNASSALSSAQRGTITDGAAGISTSVVGDITIDQLIANALYDAQATSPKLRTLALGHPLVITNGNCVQGTILGTGPNEPVFPLLDAAQAHETVFGITNQDEVLVDLQKSYLDFVKDDIRAFEAELPTAEKQKMQQYLQSVREVEQSLTSLANCEELPVPDFEQVTENDPAFWRYMQDLAVVALSCGATRQVSMLHTYGCVHFSYTFDGVRRNHHEDVSHTDESGSFMEQILRFHADQVVYMYERLLDIPEGEGTMADNLLIQWGSDGGGSHHGGSSSHPIVWLGTAGGTMTGGRWIDYESGQYSLACGQLTAARAMGLDLQTFGDGSDPCDGPLPGVLA